MTGIRIVVTGGRTFIDYPLVKSTLDKIHQERSIILLVHGACRGADLMANRWAIDNNVPRDTYPADWDKIGLRAGFARNIQMLEETKPNLVVAFPGGKGTTHCADQARLRDIEVLDVLEVTP